MIKIVEKPIIIKHFGFLCGEEHQLTNAVNALSIIIPCHRVIGSDGSLTGYGGGVDSKRFLLDFEKKDF